MNSLRNRIAILGTLLAGLVIFGCGGGGGGSSSTTSNTSAGGTTTGPYTAYAPNQIVFGIASASGTTFNVEEITPTGSSTTNVITNIPTSIALFSQVVTVKNEFAVAYGSSVSGSYLYGIYLSSSLSTTGLKTLVSPAYTAVNSLSVTSDGSHIVYTASPASDPTGASYLYVEPISGGTPVKFGLSDGSTISPADNNTIIYVAALTGTGADQVYSRLLSAGASGAVTQLTNDANNDILPAINRTGTQIAYCSEPSAGSDTIQLLSLATKQITGLPNPSSVLPLGESFGPDGSQIAIAADTAGVPPGLLLTQPTSGGVSPTTILSNSAQELGSYGIYWTDANGRSIGFNSMATTSATRKGLAFFLRHGRS